VVLGFLEALSNVNLANAGYGIDPPSDGTCEWIFNAPTFISWIDDPEQPALLCIHGSLGSGKSTLMKHVVTSLQRSSRFPKGNIAAFFCGSSEDNTSHSTPAEIYRSLLVQVLGDASFQEDALELMNTHQAELLLSQEVHAHNQELCNVLKGLFREPGRKQVIVFIDAVDKCTDPDELVQFFQDVATMAPAAKMKICFTSQQTFPIIGSQCQHISIEDFKHEDIASYVQKRLPVLRLFSEEHQASLQRSIKERASGTFLWVILIVNLLRGYLNKGMDVHFLHGVLDDTPIELTELYRNIIARSMATNSSIETRTMVRVMQWVIFSARPLTLDEWHHVFAFIDNPCLESIDEWKHSTTYTETDSLLLQRIKRVSCGLVDVKDRQVPFRPLDTRSVASSLGAGAGSFESYQYIDVIHHSVRSFFLDGDGFALLNPKIENPIGEGHAYFLEVCIRYYFLEEMKKAFQIEPQEEMEKMIDNELLGGREKVSRAESPKTEPHLAETTEFKASSKAGSFIQNVRERADQQDDESHETMSLVSSAGASIRSFRSNKSHLRSRPKAQSRRNSSLGFFKSASTQALASCEPGNTKKSVSDYLDGLELPSRDVIPDKLTLRHPISNSTIDSWSEQFKVVDDPPSLWQYCHDMVVYHAIGAEETSTVPEKALEFLLSQNIKVWVAIRKDMLHGATLHYFAAQWNLVSWLQYFRRRGLAILPGGLLRYPVIVSAKKDCLEAFQYLVKQDDDEESLLCVDFRLRTALHYAAMFPNSSILSYIEFLTLEPAFGRRYNTDMLDDDGRTPLHLAAYHASDRNVKALLSIGANVNRIDRYQCTPLHLACFRKDPDLPICKTLVDAGCNYLRRNCSGKTALQLAQEIGHSRLVDYFANVALRSAKLYLASNISFVNGDDNSGFSKPLKQKKE
jgi:hypothetical protein